MVIIDEATGEMRNSDVELEQIEFAAGLTYDDLLEAVGFYKGIAERASFMATAAQAQILKRMEVEEASILETPAYSVTLVAATRYDYNLEKLETLKSLITATQFDKAMPRIYKPDKRALNSLVKLGGEVKKVIEASISSIQGAPSLKIVKKESLSDAASL